MNILVTGGAGYIGSNTCKALAMAGFTPVTFDNLSTGHQELVKWGPFVYGDILNLPHLLQAIRTYDIKGVIHFAASSCVGESVQHPGKYYQNNISGTLSLLEAMRLCEVQHIVFSSTCAVYGTPNEVPITENVPRNPINPYGISKATIEDMLHDYSVAYGLHSVALRYFNAAGADMDGETGEWHEPETHLIPRMLLAYSGLIPELKIFGTSYPTPDGTCIRDYIHVCDLAAAHVLALAYLTSNEGAHVFNLGTGNGYSVREVLDAAELVLGAPVPHCFSSPRQGDAPVLVAQADKARQTLHWQPQYSTIEQILQSAFVWHEKLLQRGIL